MTTKQNVVNLDAVLNSSTTAPLKNVMLCSRLLQQAINRPAHLPGMVCFYGPSGWGKSFAAAYAANKFRAIYVECKSTWTKRALLEAILKEMGIKAGNTAYIMVDQISEQLALSGLPLIIDEMDHIVEKKAVEVIRDIYEGSNAPILMIGEEEIDIKLRKWERFHNRMLAWQPAQPADNDDTKHLAKLYCKDVTIADDLLNKITHDSLGITRRICVNLNLVQQAALNAGKDTISLIDWGNKPLYTGDAPRRRTR
ncbi:AAA family ATPase [Methylophaga nitratireducenticrescens]|uniref:AAA family ATPase n=1 Tax=Methylophaga nitratireducenticrescens TaxID=754476 RepID=UPI000CDCADA3|nr:ATP-binding protein [Methylophaga nitratireducenticrescens]AUZ85812.1 DNA transposition protein [Methylophaga nitratireducenticrescens]AUZ85880.1 DNA transposition protein [Methylophaga nitratireducenticrescens]